MKGNRLAKRIQYTNVSVDASASIIKQHCESAAIYGFQTVMIQPCWILLAKDILAGTHVNVATAVAYPMGGETSEMKVSLIREVLRLGADEVDFQPNIGFLKSRMLDRFSQEIAAVVKAAEGRPTKSMSEFGLLTVEEQILCITLAEKAGVTYVKNSSGIGPGGSSATVEVIRFMKQHLEGKAKIKASGKIRTYNQAIALLDAGADLIGTSAGPEIMKGLCLDETAY